MKRRHLITQHMKGVALGAPSTYATNERATKPEALPVITNGSREYSRDHNWDS